MSATFTYVCEVLPPKVFGLPEDDWTVLPSGEGETNFVSDVLHLPTRQVVERGHLSQYRDYDSRLDERCSVGALSGRLVDNYLSVEVPAGSVGEAILIAQREIELFLRALGLRAGQALEYRPIYLLDEGGNVAWTPKAGLIAKVSVYSMESLRAAVGEAGEDSKFEDVKLKRAIEYLDQGRRMWELRGELRIVSPVTHAKQVLSAVFLNLHKALAVIVGDKSKDRDHQSRFRALGFDQEFYDTEINWLHRLRDDYDVAHYDLDDSVLDIAEAQYGRAMGIVTEVLKAYRKTLSSADGDSD